MRNTTIGTILIAEDNAVISHLNQRILGRVGYEVVTARNGKEACDLIDTGDIDLAVLDLEMPIMDGFAVLKHIRNASENRSLPVIILTASYQPQDKVDSIELGANMYITKPVGTNELRLAVEKLMNACAVSS